MEAVAIISQAIIFKKPDSVLMVRQYVERGDIVWNYPGGGIEDGESAEKACIREVKEETGLDIRIIKLLRNQDEKYTYIAEVIAGSLKTEFKEKYNEDILEVKWVNLNDSDYFDKVTNPIREELAGKFEEVPDIT